MTTYQLPIGTGSIKKSKKYEKLKPLQKEVYDKVYDPINGILFFAENCAYTNRNGIEHYVPFDYQREMLFNMLHYKNVISLFSRQNGKTITSAIFICWYATVFDHKEILVCAQSKDAAIENLSKIKLAYEYCPNFLKKGLISDNKSTMQFDNGSRIIVRPSTVKAPRGLSPSIVYCDEFAFIGVQDSAEKALEKQEEFYGALSPTLSTSKGSLFITSTPMSETDLFYRLWEGAKNKLDDYGLDIPCDYILKINGELYRDFHLFKTKEEASEYAQKLYEETNDSIEIVEKLPIGYNGFQSQLVRWDACPLKDKEWAEKEIRRVGFEKFEREYNCINGKTMINIMKDDGTIIQLPIQMFHDFY